MRFSITSSIDVVLDGLTGYGCRVCGKGVPVGSSDDSRVGSWGVVSMVAVVEGVGEGDGGVVGVRVVEICSVALGSAVSLLVWGCVGTVVVDVCGLRGASAIVGKFDGFVFIRAFAASSY